MKETEIYANHYYLDAQGVVREVTSEANLEQGKSRGDATITTIIVDHPNDEMMCKKGRDKIKCFAPLMVADVTEKWEEAKNGTGEGMKFLQQCYKNGTLPYPELPSEQPHG